MSTSSLKAVNRMLYWQKAVLAVWTIACLRQCYWLYDYVTILVDDSINWTDDSSGEIRLLISFGVRIIQVGIYFLLIREMRKQSVLIKQYTNEQSKYSFMLIISSQSQIWKYLTVSFLIGLIMMFFYVIESFINYREVAAF